ncbi:MAG: phage late control D family protein [Gemmatimonadales bacterium]
MPDLGIRLQLLAGPTVPVPAPFAVMDALIELTVTNRDKEIDGFQLKLTLGRTSGSNYPILADGTLDPPNRVIVAVLIGFSLQVLIDGIVTQHQVTPGNRPGQTVLVVTGEDITRRLDLEEKKRTFENQSDSAIVETILREYLTYGLVPEVTSTDDSPSVSDRVPSQRGTDLSYIRELAERNQFVFYIEPTGMPGINTAHWGKNNRQGTAQPFLTLNMGPLTNVDEPIAVTFNAMGPEEPQISILDPFTKLAIPVPIPTGFTPSLSGRPAAALRKTQPTDTANLSAVQAALRALTASAEASDAVTVTGEVDAVRYGRVLQSRRLVELRGAGEIYDGKYYVREVTHQIRRGFYRQTFTLTREGLGAS